MTSRAPVREHGSLVEIAGIGVLLRGRSGIGKSESTLELVMRGHRLVADDVVLIEAGEEGLVGRADELIGHYMELRGIGIVHVPSLFGRNAVVETHGIDLVVQLEAWGSGEVERMGLERDEVEIAGRRLPWVHLPVAPGRNIASLIEVAARNHLGQQQGAPGAAELEARVAARLREGGG